MKVYNKLSRRLLLNSAGGGGGGGGCLFDEANMGI